MFLSKKYAIYNEATLLSLMKKGDERAFKAIYDRFWQKLLALAIYKTGSREKAQDIVQDLFVNLWERRENIEVQNLENYLFSAIKYKIIDQIKLLLKEKIFISIENIEVETGIEDLLTISDLEAIIEDSINSLPEKTAQIFKQSRFEGKSINEIAQTNELTAKAVEYHITKALKVFKENLKDYLPLIVIIQNF